MAIRRPNLACKEGLEQQDDDATQSIPGVPPGRSSEELAMRDHIIAWGRERWPDARVYHELEVSECRIDLAFIRPADLIGFEIKSSKDTLDRLEKQKHVFSEHFPELWFAIAPRWEQTPGLYFSNKLVIDADAGIRKPPYGFPPGHRHHFIWPAMLCLLLAPEVRRIAHRLGISYKSRTSGQKIREDLAFRLPGQTIVREVCRELRARNTRWPADPPIIDCP